MHAHYKTDRVHMPALRESPEAAHHWLWIMNSFVFVMLAISLFPVACAVVHADEPTDQDWVVATLARDGSWGVGTDHQLGAANAAAVRDCKAMSGGESGCGAEFAAAKRGWIIGLRCDGYHILVAERELKDAEVAAINREIDLKQIYVRDLPPCHRVLTISPRGEVTTASPRISSQP
jgi:hypothetical protein